MLSSKTEHFGKRAAISVLDNLRAARSVYAHHTGKSFAVLVRDLVGHRHRPIASTAPIREQTRSLALEHAGTEGLVPHSPFQYQVEAISQIEAIGACEHAAVTQGSRTVLHRALKPHDDSPGRQQFGDPARETAAHIRRGQVGSAKARFDQRWIVGGP